MSCFLIGQSTVTCFLIGQPYRVLLSDLSTYRALLSDWSTYFALLSDWSIYPALLSDWSTYRALLSDWWDPGAGSEAGFAQDLLLEVNKEPVEDNMCRLLLSLFSLEGGGSSVVIAAGNLADVASLFLPCSKIQ